MEMITTQGFWKGGAFLCSQVVQFHSYMSKADCFQYAPKAELASVCGNSISKAVEMGAGGTGAVDAARANLPVACKQEMESVFRTNGLPLTVASVACEKFLPKAEAGLSSGELDPSEGGSTFCLGQSISGQPFTESEPSPMPQGFPLTKSDWRPKLTLAHLHDMVVHAHKTGQDGFNFFDTNKDGQIDGDEWKAMCEALSIPRLECENLKSLMDTSKSGTIDNKEWQTGLGTSLPELVAYNSNKHGNAQTGWKAADKNGDGKLTPEEWDAFCVGLGELPGIAKPVFGKVDSDGDGSINEEEFRNAFGVDVPELRRRARAKYGPPSKSFPAIDGSKDGLMQPPEFMAAAKAMNIPEDRAEQLMAEIDTNADGVIDPQEWDDAMSMSGKEVKQEVNKALGPDAMNKLDADGDGKVGADEIKKGLEKAGLSPGEADDLPMEMERLVQMRLRKDLRKLA
jgi:Ca2+-binding EF-hand superfamily protein